MNLGEGLSQIAWSDVDQNTRREHQIKEAILEGNIERRSLA